MRNKISICFLFSQANQQHAERLRWFRMNVGSWPDLRLEEDPEKAELVVAVLDYIQDELSRKILQRLRSLPENVLLYLHEDLPEPAELFAELDEISFGRGKNRLRPKRYRNPADIACELRQRIKKEFAPIRF